MLFRNTHNINYNKQVMNIPVIEFIEVLRANIVLIAFADEELSDVVNFCIFLDSIFLGGTSLIVRLTVTNKNL